MKKQLSTRNVLVSLALTAGISAPIAALAADLENGFGETCNGSGTWHFVNSQTEGATTGTLDAQFSCGTFSASPSKVLPKVLQFLIGTSGSCTLLDATTGSVPGKLVLSDFTCAPGTTTTTTTTTTPPTTTTTSSTTTTTLPPG